MRSCLSGQPTSVPQCPLLASDGIGCVTNRVLLWTREVSANVKYFLPPWLARASHLQGRVSGLFNSVCLKCCEYMNVWQEKGLLILTRVEKWSHSSRCDAEFCPIWYCNTIVRNLHLTIETSWIANAHYISFRITIFLTTKLATPLARKQKHTVIGIFEQKSLHFWCGVTRTSSTSIIYSNINLNTHHGGMMTSAGRSLKWLRHVLLLGIVLVILTAERKQLMVQRTCKCYRSRRATK